MRDFIHSIKKEVIFSLIGSTLLQVRREEAQDRAHMGCRFRGGLWPCPWHPIRCVRIISLSLESSSYLLKKGVRFSPPF